MEESGQLYAPKERSPAGNVIFTVFIIRQIQTEWGSDSFC